MYLAIRKFAIYGLPTMKVGSIPKKLLHHVVAMKVIRMTICSRMKNDDILTTKYIYFNK